MFRFIRMDGKEASLTLIGYFLVVQTCILRSYVSTENQEMCVQMSDERLQLNCHPNNCHRIFSFRPDFFRSTDLSPFLQKHNFHPLFTRHFFHPYFRAHNCHPYLITHNCHPYLMTHNCHPYTMTHNCHPYIVTHFFHPYVMTQF